MEEADYLRALIRQGIHEPALIRWHPDFSGFKDGRNVVMETEAHGG
jgi:hypothetical protein